MAEGALLERGETAPAKTPTLRPPWQPGQSGNPKGRPKGSRNKLGEAFTDDLLASWEQHGPETIEQVRRDKPDQYLKVVASIIPQEVHHSTVEDYASLSDDELYAEFLRAAGRVQARLDAREGDRTAGAIEGSAREVPE